MLKVMTIVGTRPELIKMSRVIDVFDRHTRHVLVHTGQNYDYTLNKVFFEDLGIRDPDHFLEAAGRNAAESIARIIERADAVFEQERPDALMLYGDTNSCLAVIPAKRRRIPVFHMEAGNRCFDQRVPEELNRKVVDHLSDINMVLSEHARRYLVAEGVRAETIIKTGSHMREVLAHHAPAIRASTVLQSLGLEEGGYFVASIHREENVDGAANLRALLEAFNALAAEHGLPIIVSTHPRTRRRMEEFALRSDDPRVRFVPAFGFLDYIRLQTGARCVISDSGTLSEEAAILGFPAVTVREAHERPEGFDAGAVIMADPRPAALLDAVRVATATQAGQAREEVADYAVAEVSAKILRTVVSYTNYVRRTVWRDTGREPA